MLKCKHSSKSSNAFSYWMTYVICLQESVASVKVMKSLIVKNVWEYKG